MNRDSLHIEGTLSSLKQLLLLYGSQDNVSLLMQQYVAWICPAIDSLYGLLEDFQELHTIHSGNGPQYTDFDLMELLNAVAERLHSDAHPDTVALTLPAVPTEVRVVADRNRFRKTLYYFLSGTLVPAGEGGSARIDLTDGNRVLRVLVVTPLQPDAPPVQEGQPGIFPEKLLRFYTARELIRYQGGNLICTDSSARYSRYIVLLPLFPQIV